jgi:hypothetical protein
MPLINFRTDLTRLRFGADRPGGGDSGQPYMQFPIDNFEAPANIRRYYEANRTGLDFPVRGGAITQLLTGGTGIISSTIDRERIQKFFRDAPRGTAFIEKQIGLQLTNPRTQVPNALAFASPGLGNAYLPVTNVYNPLNTLAQVQVQGTGAHFNRHGVGPTLIERVQQTYAYVAGAPQNNTAATNRLSILRALKLTGTADFILNPNLIGGTGIDPTLVDRMGISRVQDQLFNYIGGPGSVYGIGNTLVKRVTNTDTTRLSDTNPDPNFTVNGDRAVSYSTIALTYQQLAEQGNSNYSPVQQPIQDFRYLTNGDSRPIITFNDYSRFNIANPFDGTGGLGIGNPGAPANRQYDVSDLNGIGLDQVNSVNPLAEKLYYNPSQQDPWEVTGKRSKDIIKFAFECIDNDQESSSIPLIFRAFLEGQISDSNQAEYNTFKYLGRGETFRTYQGFDRTIGFTFKVFVQSRFEMTPVYTKLNQLISQVYPDYSPEYNLMRGNVVRLTIGDYIYRMPGFLENVNVTIDNSNTPWEILLYEFGESTEPEVRQLPHMVTVQCSFKPIMDMLPRKVSRANPFVPLIVNGDHFIDPTAVNANSDDPSLRKALTFPNDFFPLVPEVGIQTNTQVATQTTVTQPPVVQPSIPKQAVDINTVDFGVRQTIGGRNRGAAVAAAAARGAAVAAAAAASAGL